jgi:hypothetical protein
MSACALLVLLGGIVVVNERVRQKDMVRLGAESAAQLKSTGARVQKTTSDYVEAMRNQTIDSAALLIFVVAGGALMFFMLRT